MSAPYAPETLGRTAIAPYVRDESQPLNRLRLDSGTRSMIADRRLHWTPYLTGAAHRQAPLATRFVPILAGDDTIDDPEIAWPATLYPAGFRQQVFDHCAIEPAVSWVAEGRRPDSVVRRILTGRGRPDPQAEAGRSGRDRLRLALTLNSLSHYRATVELLSRYARSIDDDPHLTYEVARAAYQIGGAGSALEVFGALTGDGHASLPVRLNAAARLVAHYARSGDDLEVCERWVRACTAMVPVDAGTRPPDLVTGLAISRVHRAVALYASRQRDPARVTEALQAADAANRASEQLLERGSGRLGLRDLQLRELELQQNERLILEAALKAYVATGGRVDPLGAAGAAARLGEIDPWDPYTRLTVGDARWILGDDERALESYDITARLGTLAGAQAAHRAAVVLVRTGRRAEARVWQSRAVELDPAATQELPGG